MSLTDQVQHHQRMESYYAKAAVRGLQSGVLHGAAIDMELAALNRHLAHELEDTEEIAQAAFMEWSGEQLAKRRAASAAGSTEF